MTIDTLNISSSYLSKINCPSEVEEEFESRLSLYQTDKCSSNLFALLQSFYAIDAVITKRQYTRSLEGKTL